MKKISLAALVLIVLPLVVPAPGQAIPAFARKYGFNCMMCHTAYPKLNDWGQRYRDNGYQLPGQTGKEKTIFDSHTPISLRTGAALNGYTVKPGEDMNALTTSGFGLRGLDLLAAGVLHKNVSVLVIYTPRIDEPYADYTGTAESQPGALESANIVFSNILPGALNVRVGRFEPAFHQMSSKRSYYLTQPYEIYGFAPNSTGFVFDDNQIGIEATGWFRSGLKYAAGVVNGTGAAPDNNKWKDVYGSLTYTLGAGDGQNAGQRFGVFAYYGKAPLSLHDNTVVSPTGEAPGCSGDPYYRAGGSASFNWKTLNLGAMYVWGSDDEGFNLANPLESYDYSGGFVELDWAGLWNNRLVASALYNWIAPPDEDAGSAKLNAYAGLVRYYIGDWSAVNVALHGEYAYRTLELGEETTKEHLYTMLVDFAF